MGREGSGEAETGSKWSDGFSGGPGTDFGQKLIKKTWENNDFLIFPRGGAGPMQPRRARLHGEFVISKEKPPY